MPQPHGFLSQGARTSAQSAVSPCPTLEPWPNQRLSGRVPPTCGWRRWILEVRKGHARRFLDGVLHHVDVAGGSWKRGEAERGASLTASSTTWVEPVIPEALPRRLLLPRGQQRWISEARRGPVRQFLESKMHPRSLFFREGVK
ncbi:hypothetical protein BRADI_3g33661v3 [Brachypodium distachyon]|uniref:Uncharacterized protein n=1 Tax=Brachypodium distachyon TaxID=15368 RepID=A0A2K2D0W3_BRADI|nr:hypothetical protein BRADI_3g33661v3 [Brachypodium distachyon]PNT67916.1 hypothetical protein BRADI_3g33661v3 [Brachypodium distachyon]